MGALNLPSPWEGRSCTWMAKKVPTSSCSWEWPGQKWEVFLCLYLNWFHSFCIFTIWFCPMWHNREGNQNQPYLMLKKKKNLAISETPDIVVQLLSHIQLFATPRTAALQAALSFTICQSLLKLMSIELVMSSGCLILCLPLLLLPSIFPSIRVFSIESDRHIRWPKYWSFSTSPSNEYSGLISFRTDWFDLLAVQGTLKIQDYNTKASILRHSAFFMVQISHPYMTPWY